jgi:hypothetical protein
VGNPHPEITLPFTKIKCQILDNAPELLRNTYISYLYSKRTILSGVACISKISSSNSSSSNSSSSSVAVVVVVVAVAIVVTVVVLVVVAVIIIVAVVL